MKKLLISAENAEFQIIQALKENRSKRARSGEVFVEGIECIKQAEAAGLGFTRIITAGFDALSDWTKDFVRRHPESVACEMDRLLYKKICDKEEPSEMVATIRTGILPMAEAVLPDNPFVLIFDRPSDHGNFGSLIRSANSLGVDAVFVVGHGIDVFEPKVIRSSLGSVFHARIYAVESHEALSGWLARQKVLCGLSMTGTDSTGEVSLEQVRLRRPLALVLGNEAKGMSVALRELCDQVVRIPLSGAVNSLNVSCAGSIFLWEIWKNGLSGSEAPLPGTAPGKPDSPGKTDPAP